MITVKIDEDVLLEMLMDRVEFWTDDELTRSLFRDYYEDTIAGGCFDGCELDIRSIVDNDYVNNLITVSEEDFKQYGIEDETDDKIVASNEYADLYLIRTY